MGDMRAFAAGHTPIGVQLYTVRNLAEGDLREVLKQIRAIGYEEVETYSSVYSHPAAQLRQMILDAGLTVPSGHFDYNGMAQNFDYAKKLGVKWIVCPMLPRPLGSSLEGFQQAAKQFNEWGKQAQQMGMRFAFHNHDYEFRKFNGTTGYDVLMKETDPSLVFFELDCYWVAQAGIDPVSMMKKLGRRVRMVHLKDRKPGFPPSNDMSKASAHFTEVGSGSIDWHAVIREAQSMGIEYYFVEQDQTDTTPMASIKQSYKYLRTILT